MPVRKVEMESTYVLKLFFFRAQAWFILTPSTFLIPNSKVILLSMGSQQRFVITIFFLLASSAAFANQPDYCHGPDVQKIQVPYYPDRPGSPVFDLAFQYVKNIELDAPTIIFLPGGPGGRSMQQWTPMNHFFFTFPKEGYNYILTDPRSRGCNEQAEGLFPEDALSTDYLASDIIAIVGYLKLEKFILYGHSYGTMLATVVANRLEMLQMRPMAVVLSSSVGRARKPRVESVYQDFVLQWENFKKALPQSISERLSGLNLPFDLSRSLWGTFISNGLIEGTSYVVKGNRLRKMLLALESENSTDLDNLRDAVASSTYQPPSEGKARIYRQITCQEIAEDVYDGPDELQLINGSLQIPAPNLCRDLHLRHPFDSSAWKIKAPIFYFGGGNDPATPTWQQRYHFDGQTQAKRFMVTIPDSGHGAFAELTYCKEAIWNSIGQNGVSFETTLATCQTPTQLEISEAQ